MPSKSPVTRAPNLPEVADEPGMAERFQRGLQRALNTLPQHRTKPPDREAPKRRKGRTQS
jgi:hypothetical protein